MAIDSYMCFKPYNGDWLASESQVDLSKNNEKLMTQPNAIGGAGKVFEIDSYNFDIEQTLSIGSQSSGAGAGKITFNPFSISRKSDKMSPTFFQMACSGTAFQQVTLLLRKSVGAGGNANMVSGQIFLRFDFKLVAVKTISWEHDDESPKEEITFEYGGLQVRYNQQDASGDMSKFPVIASGWNRVKNTSDTDISPIQST